jgi:hypothetical protein
MATFAQRSVLILLLLMTVFNLAGHAITPSSCCTVQGSSNSGGQNPAGDTDCLACLLQVGFWIPGALITDTNSGPSVLFSENHSLKLGLVSAVYHPPIA